MRRLRSLDSFTRVLADTYGPSKGFQVCQWQQHTLHAAEICMASQESSGKHQRYLPLLAILRSGLECQVAAVPTVAALQELQPGEPELLAINAVLQILTVPHTAPSQQLESAHTLVKEIGRDKCCPADSPVGHFLALLLEVGYGHRYLLYSTRNGIEQLAWYRLLTEGRWSWFICCEGNMAIAGNVTQVWTQGWIILKLLIAEQNRQGTDWRAYLGALSVRLWQESKADTKVEASIAGGHALDPVERMLSRNYAATILTASSKAMAAYVNALLHASVAAAATPHVMFHILSLSVALKTKLHISKIPDLERARADPAKSEAARRGQRRGTRHCLGPV